MVDGVELMVGARARRWMVGGLAVALAAAMVAACAPTPAAPAPNPAGLHASLANGSIELTWHPTSSGQVHGYQLQVRLDGGDWTPLPDPTQAAASFTDVAPHTQYWFRVRSAVAPGAVPNTWSPGVSAHYVEPTLPVMRIDTVGHAPILDKENYVAGSMTIDPNGSGVAPYSGTLGIRGRGNSTWGYPKKPYRVKLDTKSPLMGMSSERDWVLLANFVDKSQLRTELASRISRATDLAWTPGYRHVEVILNGRYEGVYQLAEQVEVESNRVDIEEMQPTDVAGEEVTGGYLLELDSRLEENDEPGFRTTAGAPVVVKDPDPMAPQQRSYIRNHIQTFEDRLMGPAFTDPVDGYRPYLDVAAFIDHWLLQELARNGDSFWSSTFFTKERGDDRLRFGPMWDFDRSMGSRVTIKPQPPEGWYARDNGHWTRRLFTDPAFVAEVRARWDQLMPAFASIPPQVDALGSQLAPAIGNDEFRWNYEVQPEDRPEFIRTWLESRITWMDDAFAAET